MLLERFFSEFSFDLSVFIFDIIIPCVLAMIFGGLIGIQRERHERPAGFRTHTLVCLGATVFTLVSYLGFVSFTGLDVSRIAAGVVTGIGFIGAGVIFRQGPLVKGVTTAASIWIVAAIGVSLGVKLYYLAVIAAILGFLILSILKSFESRIIRTPNYHLKISTAPGFDNIDKILDSFRDFSQDIKTKKYEFDPLANTKTYSFNIHSRTPDFSTKIIEKTGKIEGVTGITIN
ncbi:MAG: MgtC/SapB family protein [Actinomycetia bacterium]|nr:MgtC/SapB family protein [Actinomycetes bacterium]